MKKLKQNLLLNGQANSSVLVQGNKGKKTPFLSSRIKKVFYDVTCKAISIWKISSSYKNQSIDLQFYGKHCSLMG